VAEGDLVVVLEAMKMEQPLHRAQGRRGGRDLRATGRRDVTAGATICEIAASDTP